KASNTSKRGSRSRMNWCSLRGCRSGSCPGSALKLSQPPTNLFGPRLLRGRHKMIEDVDFHLAPPHKARSTTEKGDISISSRLADIAATLAPDHQHLGEREPDIR